MKMLVLILSLDLFCMINENCEQQPSLIKMQKNETICLEKFQRLEDDVFWASIVSKQVEKIQNHDMDTCSTSACIDSNENSKRIINAKAVRHDDNFFIKK